jgi:serine/threonine-protein kinase
MKTVTILDEHGQSEPLPLPEGDYSNPRVSPGGSRFAVTKQEGPETSIWIYEWADRRFARLAFANGNSEFPVWMPDGKHLLFSSRRVLGFTAHGPTARVRPHAS